MLIKKEREREKRRQERKRERRKKERGGREKERSSFIVIDLLSHE